MTGAAGPITILNVAEKPSVARALASVFAQNPGSRDGGPIRNQGAQIFLCENVIFPNILIQGDGRQQAPASNRPHRMITTSVRGHLASQDFGRNYGWGACNPSALFHAPIETMYSNDMEPLKNMLIAKAKEVDAIILWLDCDREGEAICNEVRQVCLQGNPRLLQKVYRAKFSTVMPQEIKKALCTLGRVNENFVQAVQARSEHDLRVGAAFTRFQTLRLQKNFDEFANGSQGVVSYGPCQFPTLGFVVERWARIQTFIPEDFWLLEMSITVHGDGTIDSNTNNIEEENPPGQRNSNQGHSRPVFLKWKRDRIYDRVLTMSLYESCMDAGEATVVSLTGRPKNKWRPIPLATVELQKRASRFLRIGSETLMTAAEELYHQGLISYPRTETEVFRAEFQHIPLIQSFQAIDGVVGEYASKLLSANNFQNPRAGRNDDSAHPPITPCKAVDPNTINDRTQREVYCLVVKHYLACCSRDALGKETVLTVKMASEEFIAKGLMILERNWLEIYSPWERWSTGQGELPNVQVGSRFTPTSFLMKDGRTTAPNFISEVELISLMDRNGIGTDATIAQHISTIQDRQYAEKDPSQRFVPTKLGIALVEGYNSMGYQLNRPDLRREMEAECNAVAAGRKRKEEILEPLLTKMLECFNRATAEARKLDDAVARHFTRIGTNNANSRVIQRNFSLCGACEGFTTLKELLGTQANQNRGNGRGNQQAQARAPAKLLHCETCSVGLRLPAKGTPSPSTSAGAQNEPTKCPICNYQVISIGQGDGYTGNGYQVCPKCFSDPPAEYGGGSTNGEFRCFQCSHPTCSIATGSGGSDIEIRSCPFCGATGGTGKITLNKNARGYVLSCSNYRTTRCEYTVWLPKEVSCVEVVEESQTTNANGNANGNANSNANANQNVSCPRCSSGGNTVRKLKFKWKSGSVPPGFGREYVACVFCDQTLKSDFKVTIPQLNQVQVRGRRPNTNANVAPPRNNNNDGGGRGGRGGSTWHQNSTRGNSATRGGTSASDNRNSSRSRERNFGNGGNSNTSANNLDGIVCFRCNQPGHYASSCPNQNNR